MKDEEAYEPLHFLFFNFSFMNYSSLLPSSLIYSEVSNDLTRMFAEKRNLEEGFTYQSFSDKEFAENRRKHTQANITGWFGWEGSYSSILAARILNKSGYRTDRGSMSMLLPAEIRERINADIDFAVESFLSVFA